MNYLIDEKDVYEITCEKLIGDLSAETENYRVTIEQDQHTVWKNTIAFEKDFLKIKNMSQDERCKYALKKAARLYRGVDKREETAIVTTNFVSLKGKIVNDDEVDQELLLLIDRFFRKYPGPHIKRISPIDLFISTDFAYEKIVNRLPFLVERSVLKCSSLSGDEYELEKGGFEMIEKLLQSSRVSPLPENRYFQLVSLSNKVKEPFAFVVMPFGEDEIEQKVYYEIIKPVVEQKLKILCIRSDEVTDPGVINNQIFTLMKGAKLIIAETTSRNPNVFYEIGMAHAFDKEVFLFAERRSGPLPFDITTHRAVFYDDLDDLKQKILDNLKHHIS